ncbi:MAG: hypothetical protein ASARMPRED_007890 [Alectoria sarmentosa]|nr:MAG: hypothetical protein ASARMPRED_007890 [Alectoria sarmentosa]
MASGKKLAPLRPIALIISLALSKTKALMLHGQPPLSFNTPQVIERAEQAVTVEPYTGNGDIPVVHGWNILTTDLPIQYTPTESNTTLRLTQKDNKSQNVHPSMIYNLTVLALADIARSTVTTNGNEDFPRSGQGNSTFATSDPTSKLQFMMTASKVLPLYAVTDVLRGIQELTHYLLFLELAFEVFSDICPTSSPIASGILAFHFGSQIEPVQTRDLEYLNSSYVNLTSAPSRQLQSSIDSIQLTTPDELEAVEVTYDDLKNPLPIYDQSFADVATRMLANITELVIANQGDGLLPFYGSGNRRLLRYVDTWGSNLGISLLPINLLGINFTLGEAAMALKATQDNLSNGPMVESRLQITVDGSLVGWGCLSYANASAWRCIMPTPGSTSSVGSQSISGAANVVPDSDESY